MLKEVQGTETILNLTVEEEDVTKNTSEEEETSIESDSDQTVERDSSSSLNTTSTELSSEDTSDQEEELEVLHSSEDTDGSVNERCLLISSAANIRRREMQGQRDYYKENREEVPKERKRKLTKKDHPKRRI